MSFRPRFPFPPRTTPPLDLFYCVHPRLTKSGRAHFLFHPPFLLQVLALKRHLFHKAVPRLPRISIQPTSPLRQLHLPLPHRLSTLLLIHPLSQEPSVRSQPATRPRSSQQHLLQPHLSQLLFTSPAFGQPMAAALGETSRPRS